MNVESPVVGRETTVSGPTLTPEQIGIGMRISIHPHADDFEHIILGAIKETNQTLADANVSDGLVVETGEVSTYVGVTSGAATQKLASYAVTLIRAASMASGRRHLTSHILLSRGCPGEAECELVPGHILAEHPVHLAQSGLDVVAAWSLYPLTDGNVPHMDPILAAIEEVKTSGLEVTSEHYATIVRGDLSAVLATLFDAWATVGQHVPHVVSHLSLSLDSPTPKNAGDTR